MRTVKDGLMGKGLRALALTLVLLVLGLYAPDCVSSNTAAAAAKKRVTSVKLDQSKATLIPGATLQLAATIKPEDATNQALTWKSSNTAVAKVSKNGLVTAKKAGKATITATAKDGSKKSSKCVVTVKYKKATGVTLNASVHTLDVGGTAQLTATVKPSSATFKGVTWKSTAPQVARVDGNGLVTALSTGVAKIKATHEEGELVAECTIQVRGGEPVSITISAIGDVILGGDPRKGTEKRFATYLANRGGKMSSTFEKVYSVLSQDDLTVANLECALTTRKGYRDPEKPYIFRGKPAYAQILKEGSVEVANLANNHVQDFAGSGYRDTMSALDKYGVAYAGVKGSPAPIIKVKGVKVGFYGNMSSQTSGKEVTKHIAALKAKCDVVVASFHWTDVKEYLYTVQSRQKTIARAAVDAGADLVVGHHSHVLSGIEVYKGKYIAYSLGNFVIVGTGGDHDTFIFQQTFDVYNGFAEDNGIKVIPCRISSESGKNNIQPMVATGDEADRIIQKIKKYSKNLLGSPQF